MSYLLAKFQVGVSTMPIIATLSIRFSRIAFFVAVVVSTLANSQTVKLIHDFTGTDGYDPLYGVLAQGRDGRLYGTASGGGANGMGTIFKQRTTTGSATIVIYNFSGSDGAYPDGGLTLARDGNFYGTTSGGGRTRKTLPPRSS